MKFLRFISNQETHLGILTKDESKVLSISTILPDRKYNSMPQFIEELTEIQLQQIQNALENPVSYSSLNVSDIQICSPIEHPIHDILCIGVNYRAHQEEAKEKLNTQKEPEKAIYFTKRALRILGPNEAIQGRFDLDEELDYEVELAVIIGKRGINIPLDKVEEYIFGYSVFNDISSRKLQMQHSQWFRGKSLDTYSAMGPVILHKSALPFPVEVDVKCYINGDERQSSNTRLLLHDIPSIISELSTGMTLEPGDIIITGTPAGVGMGFDPPRYMKKGDEVICQILQIGKLVNVVE